jgi:hypothetical protein
MITEKLKHSTGDISAVRNAAKKYFSSIHIWFPILSELSYYERLASVFEKPCAEYSLLSLSMMLITTKPPVKENLDSFTSLYILVKSSIAIVAVAIGLNQTIKRPCTDVSADCSKREEGLRVWWGIVMLDRY